MSGVVQRVCLSRPGTCLRATTEEYKKDVGVACCKVQQTSDSSLEDLYCYELANEEQCGEQQRPEVERDYLRRLLDQF